MLERKFVPVSGMIEVILTDKTDGAYVLASDAQSTIADLQGQVVEAQDGTNALLARSTELHKQISQLQQRVAQLEGQLSTPTWVCDGCGRVSREGWITIVNETLDGIDYDMECPSCGVREIEEDSAADLVRELERLEDQLTTLQADHAALLGLVQALPVVPKEYLTDDFVHLGVPVTATLWAQIGPDLIALLTYRASLPAQRAKLAQGGV